MRQMRNTMHGISYALLISKIIANTLCPRKVTIFKQLVIYHVHLSIYVRIHCVIEIDTETGGQDQSQVCDKDQRSIDVQG